MRIVERQSGPKVLGKGKKVLTEKKKRYGRSHWELTLMLLPGIIYTFIFSYMPMPGLMLAFKDFKYKLGVWGSPWVGFENFKFLFESSKFTELIRNTVLYNVSYIACGIIFPVFFAILLYQIKRNSTLKILQSCYLLPTFISSIILSYLVYAFLAPKSGYINNLIMALGGKRISFYSDAKYWPFLLVFINTWSGVGFNALIHYGSIMGIDSSLFDAAEIDGCGEWKKIKYIMLPHMKKIVVFLLILDMGKLLNSNTGLHYNVTMNSGAILSTTDVLGTYVTRGLLDTTNWGATSAISFVVSVFGCVMVLITNAIVRKYEPDSAMF